jgi:hypothetical protein
MSSVDLRFLLDAGVFFVLAGVFTFGDALGGVLAADLGVVLALGEVLVAALGEAASSSFSGADTRLSCPMLLFRDLEELLGILGLSTTAFLAEPLNLL